MTDDLTLQRGPVSPFVPAPTAIRVGPYVYTSSIYPIDAVGHAIRADELLEKPAHQQWRSRHGLVFRH